MAWMGTRDIYIAFFIVCIFILFADYLFNEDSNYNILSDRFKTHHTKIAEQMETISDQQIKEAQEVLEKAGKQKNEEQQKENMQNMKSLMDPLANVKPYM
jgi:predicted Holliday junction resolvase-like endonuclease